MKNYRLLLVVCVMALAVSVLWAQTGLTDLQRINAALTLIAPLEKQVTSTGVTNYRHIRTRLNTLKTQLLDPNRVEDPITPPPPVPIDCEVSEWVLNTTTWDVCQNGTQTGIQLWERTIITHPENGGTACGALSENRTVTQACSVSQPVLVSATVVPSSVVGGADVTLTVAVQQPVQSDTNVVLSSGDTSRAVVPGTVAILAGASSATTTITTLPQTSTTQLGVMITASLPTGDQTALITLLPSVTPPPPPPPDEICGDKIDNDGDGQVDEGCPVVPPPTGTHGYFDMVCKLTGATCYSLRDPKQLATRANGGYSINNSRTPSCTYDSTMDAAKCVIGAGQANMSNQIRLPIPKHSPQSLFVTWDGLFGTEWINGGISDQKTWQIGSPFNDIHLEIRNRYSQARNQSPGNIAMVDGRLYPEGGYSVGPNITATGTLAPQVGKFAIKPNTWTRWYAFLDVPDAAGWYRYSLWVADAGELVQIFDKLQVRPSPASSSAAWESFWLEFNTSTNTRAGTTFDLVAYVRNVATVKGLANVSSVLIRP